VAARSEALGVPCSVGRPDRELEPTQEAFRSARYGFLEDVADQVEAERIATGHQADDQAETVLFRILRGTGLRGLGGIPERRGRIVRPLLPFERDEILAWLEARGIEWLEDPSNADSRWARGRLRTEVLPALEEARGEPVEPALRALASTARRADRALEDVAQRAEERVRRRPGADALPGWDDDAVILDRDVLLESPDEIVARVVRRLARRLGVELTRGGPRSAVQFIIEGRSGGWIDLGDGLELAREFDRIVVGRSREPAPDTRLEIPGRGPGRGEVWIGGRRWHVTWGDGSASDPRLTVDLAVDAVHFPLEARGRRAGDRLRRAGGDGKLKKAFRTERIPASTRDHVPLLAEPPNRVVWAAGVGTDPERAPVAGGERFRVTWKKEEP
jgi:tRNA(Ile)-lysidine synthase